MRFRNFLWSSCIAHHLLFRRQPLLLVFFLLQSGCHNFSNQASSRSNFFQIFDDEHCSGLLYYFRRICLLCNSVEFIHYQAIHTIVVEPGLLPMKSGSITKQKTSSKSQPTAQFIQFHKHNSFIQFHSNNRKSYRSLRHGKKRTPHISIDKQNSNVTAGWSMN